MTLYLPNGFVWGVPSALTDETGRTRYRLTGEAYSLGKRLHVADLAGREAVYSRQTVPALFPRYELEVYGKPVGALVQTRRAPPRFALELPGWELSCAPEARRWTVLRQGEPAALCQMEDSDRLRLSLDVPGTELPALAVLLTACCFFPRF